MATKRKLADRNDKPKVGNKLQKPQNKQKGNASNQLKNQKNKQVNKKTPQNQNIKQGNKKQPQKQKNQNNKQENKIQQKKQEKNTNQQPESTKNTEVVESTNVGPRYTNKQRVLVVASRGIASRYRHLMEDVKLLLPHHKKENKLDARKNEFSSVINEISEIRGCNNCIFFECRKKSDLYLWVSKTPTGPSAKFHVLNVHTMDELKLTGNCMKGARPLLNFDDQFDSEPHWKTIKLLFIDAFGVPKGHPKSKPFIDRIMSFYILDNKIWVRNYQIVDNTEAVKAEMKLKKNEKSKNQGIKKNATDGATEEFSNENGKKSEEDDNSSDLVNLVEIGPRFVLNPIKIFSQSFSGASLFQNPMYISPNEVRREYRRQKGDKYVQRQTSEHDRQERLVKEVAPDDELDYVFEHDETRATKRQKTN